MISAPTSFQDERDLESMRQLVADGRAALACRQAGTYYVHPGDLNWWYTYFLPGCDPREHTYLWLGKDGQLDGFTLFAPDWDSVDVFVRPGLCSTSAAAEMWTWGLDYAARLIQQRGAEDGLARIITMWIDQNDAWLQGLLARQGFQPGEGSTVCMVQSITSETPEPVLPPGFTVRPVDPARDLETRAAAQSASFESELPFDRYIDRYTRFTQNPAYSQALDLMIESPSGRGAAAGRGADAGRAAAFCICWLDPLNRRGAFEPVGVHPDFQRMGLGKAIMHAGLHAMRSCGMQSAQVCTGASHTPAVRMYAAAGFHVERNLVHFLKPIP